MNEDSGLKHVDAAGGVPVDGAPVGAFTLDPGVLLTTCEGPGRDGAAITIGTPPPMGPIA